MNPARQVERRPIEHLAGDVHLARQRLAWAQTRSREMRKAPAAADVLVHTAALDEARRHLRGETERIRGRGEIALTRRENDRARFAAMCRYRAERRDRHCGCWRCVDARTDAIQQAGEPVTFKVQLGPSLLEVKVARDGDFICAQDLDRDLHMSPFELLHLAAQLGRLTQLDRITKRQLEAVAC